jgi:hypothetical protein
MNMPGVRWHLAVPPEVTTEYVGTTIGGYYQDAETMWRTQTEGRERFRRLYGVELGGPRSEPPAYAGAAALGAELRYPEDDAPQIHGHPVTSADQVEALKLPGSYLETEAMRPFVEIRRWMEARTGDGRHVPIGAGIEGPITTAKLLRGQDFFLDVYENPRAAHRLLDLVTESCIRFSREVRVSNGGSPDRGGTGIADDFAGLLSPAMWPEFVVPYYRRIYEAFGEGSRGQHSELLRPGHLKFLLDLGVTSFDPGQDQYLTLAYIRQAAPGLPFTWNLKTVSEMREGTPDSIRQAYEAAVRGGAASIMAEICRATPEANIRAFVEIGREMEGK